MFWHRRVDTTANRCWTHPGGSGRVGVVEQGPDLRLPNFAAAPRPVGTVLDAEPPRNLPVVVGVLRVRRLEYLQGFLRVPVLPVGHPAARLHVRLVDPPEREFLLEQGPAHVRRAVQLASPVVVEHVGEDARVSVEEELGGARGRSGRGVGAGLRLRVRQPRQAGPRQRPQGALVGLMSSAAHVDDNFVRVFPPGHLLLQTCFRRWLVARLAPPVRRDTHGADHWEAETLRPFAFSSVTSCCPLVQKKTK